jgi:hypothetical protein
MNKPTAREYTPENTVDTLPAPFVNTGLAVPVAFVPDPVVSESEPEDDVAEKAQVRFLNSVAASNTAPSLLPTNSFVTCVQLWKTSLLQLYSVSFAKSELLSKGNTSGSRPS